MADNFTEVPIHHRNCDRWIVRRTIRDVILAARHELSGSLLDVGCGRMPYRRLILTQTAVQQYTGLDIDSELDYGDASPPDFTWDGVTMPFAAGTFDCVLATEVFEHVPEIDQLLHEIKRVLKAGGRMYFTTPFIWPYHDTPHDHQRWTAYGLRAKLEKCGFSKISVTSKGNWHSALAQMLGLWVTRAPMPRLLRAVLRRLVFATQILLMKFDADTMDQDNSMPRLIIGTAAT